MKKKLNANNAYMLEERAAIMKFDGNKARGLSSKRHRIAENRGFMDFENKCIGLWQWEDSTYKNEPKFSSYLPLAILLLFSP